MTDYKRDRVWSDKFLPEIKRALEYWMGGNADIASDMQDMTENTDMLLLGVNQHRIACRIRKFAYCQRYPNDFTIRSDRDNGAKTELAKLLEGYGDYVFYGFADPTETRLVSAFLGDLGAFRAWYKDGMGIKKDNADGTRFLAFDRRRIPGFIIKQEPAPGANQ